MDLGSLELMRLYMIKSRPSAIKDLSFTHREDVRQPARFKGGRLNSVLRKPFSVPCEKVATMLKIEE